MTIINLTSKDLDRIGRVAGWAPGLYTGICRDCGSNMVADKRASQCFVCAVIAIRDRPPSNDKQAE